MYETIISVDNKHLDWLDELGSRIYETLGGEAVTACSIGKASSFISVGADGRISRKIEKRIARVLSDLILGRIKYDYIMSRIGKLRISEASKKLLSHALTVFDRETEQEMLADSLTLGKKFSLDGYYNFRMGELVSRWSEICQLAVEHSAYLSDEDTMNELLRFLIDACKSTGNKAEVFRLGNKYRIVEHRSDGETGERTCEAFDDLLCHLIDLSPEETVLNGFDYDAAFVKLYTIFDVKSNILR